MTRSFDSQHGSTDGMDEVDLRALGGALRRRRGAIATVTFAAFVLVAIFVSVVTPRYTAETQILLENQETFFTRPDRVNVQTEQALQFDPEAVASQVQLINSRDIARRAIKDLKLEGDPEFDPQARGLNPLKRVLILLGLMRDPTREAVDQRIVTAFLDKLTVYSPPKTRVISIQFTSKDPDLAARGANDIAALYLKEQSAAKRGTARDSADALTAQIADLRLKLASADAERENYRLKSGLLAGSNNMTVSGQQLADINTDLSKARTAQADAQAKASTIRDLLRAGKATDVPDVINNDIVRRISDQRATAQGQLALQSRTLLPGHPQIKALTAQVAEFDIALKNAARQAAASLENDAKIAGARVANLETVLAQQKKIAGVANVDQVHLQALERAAQSYKDQLESSTTKYQEAMARESSDATPADARVISRAVVPQEPSYPKKLPFIIFGTVAAFVFMVGFVVAAELLSGRASLDDRHAGVAGVASDDGDLPREDRTAATSADTPVEPALARKGRKAPLTQDDDLVFAPVEEKVAGVKRTRRSRQAALASVKAMMSAGVLGAVARYIQAFGQPADTSRRPDQPSATLPRARSSRYGWEPDMIDRQGSEPSTLGPAPETSPEDHAVLARRIVAAHVPGRGLHVVGTSLGAEGEANGILLRLSRTLAEKGRTIIVDLNRSPTKLAELARGEGTGDGRAKIMGLIGLAELLSGDASFAQVIHRDKGSRLHFIPAGRQDADFRDFDLILDALSETYDFIVLLTPAYPQSEIAKIMAPYADFVVLAAASEPDLAMLARLEAELTEAGAQEILVAAMRPNDPHAAQDVA